MISQFMRTIRNYPLNTTRKTQFPFLFPVMILLVGGAIILIGICFFIANRNFHVQNDFMYEENLMETEVEFYGVWSLDFKPYCVYRTEYTAFSVKKGIGIFIEISKTIWGSILLTLRNGQLVRPEMRLGSIIYSMVTRNIERSSLKKKVDTSGAIY